MRLGDVGETLSLERDEDLSSVLKNEKKIGISEFSLKLWMTNHPPFDKMHAMKNTMDGRIIKHQNGVLETLKSHRFFSSHHA